MNQEHSRRSDPTESGTVQRVRKSVRALPFNLPHVLLACSGGKDSVALALILSTLHRLDLITLSIAHIHHDQHDQADAAADAVRAIARTLHVPVFVHKLESETTQRHSGVGLEEALRRERYLALANIAMELEADCLAIAHHEGDQAETVLLHLMRGSGLDGLVGMREWELRQIPWWETDKEQKEIAIWRPLLHESGQDVARIADQSHLPIVEDPTNIDTSFRRNAIRHDLLPIIEQIAPGASAAIARTSDLLADDADHLNQLSQDHMGSLLTGGNLRRDGLIDLPQSMQRRVLRTWILTSHPQLELSFDRVTAALHMAHRNRGGARVELGSGVTIGLHHGLMTLDSWQNRDD